jgi:hypothetical protein
MITNTSRVIQHKRKSAITKIKSPTARRRRALSVCRCRLSTTFHARRQPAIGRTLSVLQDMTPVVADYSQLHFSRIVA